MYPICHTCGTTKTKTSEHLEPAHLNWSCLSLQCEELRALPDNPQVRFNIHHLSRQNREGVTTAEEVRDVLSNVKPEDREKIGRAR